MEKSFSHNYHKGTKRLSYEECFQWLLEKLSDNSTSLEIHPEKLCVDVSGAEFSQRRLWWPTHVPAYSDETSLRWGLSQGVPQPLNTLLILIQAGHCALGFFEAGQVVEHKVIKKYMVRKKQGKAQITYMKTKGKSRAGSRIRLANSVAFFEEINERMTAWNEGHSIQRILYVCPVRLWAALFQAKNSPFFKKSDPRLFKLPMNTRTPSYDELLLVNRLIGYGYLE